MRLSIYVASSWRNEHQQDVVRALRLAGHEVYDFRAAEGFSWKDIDSNWKNWTTEEYKRALEHPLAKKGYEADMAALMGADLCVLVLPAGRSAAYEFGHHCGRTGRPGIVYIPEPCEPELMFRASSIVEKLEDVLALAERQP